MRRDADELDGFLDFLAGEIAHAGLAAVVQGILGDATVRSAFRALPAAGAEGHHGYAGGLLEHTVGVATLCRETAQLHPRLRSDLLLAAALLHDVGRTLDLGRGPSFRQTEEGGCSGTCTSVCASSRSGRLPSTPRCAQSCCTRSPSITTGRRPAPPKPPSSTTRTSSTPRPPPGPSARTDPRDSGGAGARRSSAVGHGRLLRRRRDPPFACAHRPLLVAARRARGSRGLDRRDGSARPGVDLSTRRRREWRARSDSAASTAGWRSARWGSWRRSRRPRRSCRSRSRSSRGDSPAPVQWAGIALALAGVVLVSREPGWPRRTPGGRRRPRPRRRARIRPVHRRARRGGPAERILGGRLRPPQLRRASSCSRSPGRGRFLACRAGSSRSSSRSALRHRCERVDRGRDDPRLDRDRRASSARSIRSRRSCSPARSSTSGSARRGRQGG